MTPAVVQVMGWRSQQYGSFERFLVAVARGCADAGLASHFVFPSRPPSEAFLADAGAELHCVQSPRPPADPRFALDVRRIVRRVGASHLHAHFGLDAYQLQSLLWNAKPASAQAAPLWRPIMRAG